MTPKLTAQGYNLLVNALDGTGLNFTKIKIGNGDVPDEYVALTDLVNPIVSIGITTITKDHNYVVLRAPMSNSNFDAGFEMAEMGVFVANPDGGEDILYAYAHYILDGDDAAVYVPPVASNLVEITHKVYVYIGELENVSAIIAESSVYASADALKAHIEDTGNPHKVDKVDVGLGNVPNVTPENQQPNFPTAYVGTVADDGKVTIPNITPGERMYSILQKVRTVIFYLLNHINARNPHGMQATDVGAAEKNHHHSANDINSGTLGIARGGIGAGTAEEGLKNLGGISKKLLWENSDPDSDFDAQELDASIYGYDMVEIIFRSSTLVNIVSSASVPVSADGVGTNLVQPFSDCYCQRYVSLTEKTITVESAKKYAYGDAEGTDTEDNMWCIPYRIYGVKGVT